MTIGRNNYEDTHLSLLLAKYIEKHSVHHLKVQIGTEISNMYIKDIISVDRF